MQVLIDTAVDSPSELLAISKFLAQFAAGKSRAEADATPHEALGATDGVELAQRADGQVIRLSGRIRPTPAVPPAPTTPPPPAPEVDEDDSDTRSGDYVEDMSQGATTGVVTIPPPPPPVAVVLPPITPPTLRGTGHVGSSSAPQQGGDYDIKGIKWDPNAHAANRAKTIGGEWKAKRQREGAGNVPPAPPAAPPAPQPVAPVPQAAAPVTVPPPPPVAASVSVGGPLVSVTSFRNLMLRVSAGTKAGTLTKVQVDEGLVSVGLKANELTGLAQNPALIPAMVEYLDQLGVSQ